MKDTACPILGRTLSATKSTLPAVFGVVMVIFLQAVSIPVQVFAIRQVLYVPFVYIMLEKSSENPSGLPSIVHSYSGAPLAFLVSLVAKNSTPTPTVVYGVDQAAEGAVGVSRSDSHSIAKPRLTPEPLDSKVMYAEPDVHLIMVVSHCA